MIARHQKIPSTISIHSNFDREGVFGYTKILGEDLGYTEDEMTVGYGPKDFLTNSFAEFHHAVLMI